MAFCKYCYLEIEWQEDLITGRWMPLNPSTRLRHRCPRAYQRQAPPTSPPPPQVHSPYSVLYVSPDAPQEVIQAAYRALANLYHPDRGGNPEKMKALNIAFQEISRSGR
jgi:DnaJ-class molecular chaperone